MSQRLGGVAGRLFAVLSVVAFAASELLALPASAAGGARFGGGRHGGAHGGGVHHGRSGARPSSPVLHSGFGGGPRGGMGHHGHQGFGRSGGRHSFRSQSHGHHRFHRSSSFIFDLGGFAYPPYYPYYYPPIPYYPTYPGYPIPYDPGYSAVNIPYSYSDPVGAYSQASQGNVQVYTAPPEPPPAPPPLPSPAPQLSSPSPPLEDGSLRFEVSPAEAKLFLDNRYLGEARELGNIAEITASAGRHLLEIRLDAERTFTEVVVSPRKVTPVRWNLAPSPEATDTPRSESGWLRVQVAPHGAAIYLDGIFSTVADLADPPTLPVSPGHHRVQVVMPGYKAYSTDVAVQESGEAVLAVQLARE